MRINLGGIAKGYVVERGVTFCALRVSKNGVVTAGGDSRLLGDRRGQPWMVGIRDPREEGARRDFTSAAGKRGHFDLGRLRTVFRRGRHVRYHHIITSRATGEPAGGVHSASVFGPDAVITDALSTSVFVLGVDQGLRLISTLPDYESIVIDAEGRIFLLQTVGAPAARRPTRR